MVVLTCNPTLGSQKQANCKFKISMGYRMRSCLRRSRREVGGGRVSGERGGRNGEWEGSGRSRGEEYAENEHQNVCYLGCGWMRRKSHILNEGIMVCVLKLVWAMIEGHCAWLSCIRCLPQCSFSWSFAKRSGAVSTSLRHYREKSANSFFSEKDTGLRLAKFHDLICTETSV